MKSLRTTFLISFILLLGTGFKAEAQRLFDAVPEEVVFKSNVIEGLFSQNAGTAVDIRFSQNFRLTGIVKSNQKVYSNLQTVVVSISNYSNAKFFVSRTVDENNTIKYVGRLIGRGAQDGFELKADLAGNNSLKKINIKEMIVE
jgi:hypothetical protein